MTRIIKSVMVLAWWGGIGYLLWRERNKIIKVAKEHMDTFREVNQKFIDLTIRVSELERKWDEKEEKESE